MSDRRDRDRQFRKRGYQDGLNNRRLVFPDEPAYRDAYQNGQDARDRDLQGVQARRRHPWSVG